VIHNSMGDDIDSAIRLMIEAAQCIDRVHRSLFPGHETWDDEMMMRADAGQKRLRDARKTVQKMKAMYEKGPPEG